MAIDVESNVLIRRLALLAIPLIAGGLYFARRPAPAPAEPPPAPSASAPLGLPPTDVSNMQERGEAALAKPKPSLPARDLPAAEDPTRAHPAVRAPKSPDGFCGGIQARGITAAEDPAWAFASLSPALGETAVIRRVGERIGHWSIDRIEWDRVWLRSGGTRCAVGMHAGAREAQEESRRGGKKKRALLASDDAPEQKPWRLSGEIANSLENVSDTEFSIERAMLDALFDRAPELVTGARLEPKKRDEAIVGFSLEDVQVDSIFQRLGIEDGNVVLEIDGSPCSSLEQVGKALIAARERDKIVARLERRGEAFDLHLVVR